MTEDIQIGKLQREIDLLKVKLDEKTNETNSLRETLTRDDQSQKRKQTLGLAAELYDT